LAKDHDLLPRIWSSEKDTFGNRVQLGLTRRLGFGMML